MIDEGTRVVIQHDEAFEAELFDAVTAFTAARPRQQQRTLGPSSLGGCREFIRATVAGDPGIEERPRGLDAAFVGTVVGDALEAIFAERMGARTQVPIAVSLTDAGIKVAGNSDLVFVERNVVADLKSKDRLAEVQAQGPSLENCIQISSYVVGAVESGILTEGAEGRLVYYDRSGHDKGFFAVTIDWEACLRFVELAQQRLADVVRVLEAGNLDEMRWGLRDQSPSLCFNLQCPFRASCWGGSAWAPTGAIEGEDEIKRVHDYVAARNLKTQGEAWQKEARENLKGITGITTDGWLVVWSNDEKRLDVTKA